MTLEHILLSVLVNGVGLCCVALMKSAPPRMTLYACVASMLAIFIPWASVGTEVENLVPVKTALNFSSANASMSSSSSSIESFESVELALVWLWFTVSITWLTTTILKSLNTRARWRSMALCGKAMEKFGCSVFGKELNRSRIYRLPGSSLVVTTGLWRPEIWIGEGVCTDEQVETALNHELCHIASNDQLTLLLIVIVERLLWWNPLIWLLGRQARRQMEYACDSRCQLLIGSTQYRQTLAELFLGGKPQTTALEIHLGNGPDVINRMENLKMNHCLKSKHIFSLATAGVLITIASSVIGAQSSTAQRTLVECQELVPEGAQYDFKITSNIDARDGVTGDISVTLLDTTKPGNNAIPEGSEEFVQCVGQLIGVGKNEGYPGA